MFTQLWQDENGFVISTELAIVGAVLTVGVVAGLGALRDSVLGELDELGQSINNIDNTYFVGGTSLNGPDGMAASTAGFGFTDSTHSSGNRVITGTGVGTASGVASASGGVRSMSFEFPHDPAPQVAGQSSDFITR